MTTHFANPSLLATAPDWVGKTGMPIKSTALEKRFDRKFVMAPWLGPVIAVVSGPPEDAHCGTDVSPPRAPESAAQVPPESGAVEREAARVGCPGPPAPEVGDPGSATHCP